MCFFPPTNVMFTKVSAGMSILGKLSVPCEIKLKKNRTGDILVEIKALLFLKLV